MPIEIHHVRDKMESSKGEQKRRRDWKATNARARTDVKEPQEGERHHTKATDRRFRTSPQEGEADNMKYDLSEIMGKAWKIFRKYGTSFSEALHRAWNSAKVKAVNAARIETARIAAGCREDVRTWADWKSNGYKVRSGEKAIFKALLIWASKGDGAEYRAAFFGRSQVESITESGKDSRKGRKRQ